MKEKMMKPFMKMQIRKTMRLRKKESTLTQLESNTHEHFLESRLNIKKEIISMLDMTKTLT